MSNTAYRQLFVLLLCLTSGLVDVIGYIELGHVFTANMTGNIVLLGLAVGHVQGLEVLRSILALIGFIAGTATAAFLAARSKEKAFWPSALTTIFILESMVLITFSILFQLGAGKQDVYIMIILLSYAMGIQTTAARTIGVAGISTTVLTNNLANAIEDLVKRLRMLLRRGESPERLTRDSLLRMAGVAIYGIGAVAGTIAEYRWPFFISWVPASVITAIVATAIIRSSFRDQANSN
ncbi:DUF1275 domain-containing protein [Paenibacillus sp. SYP-B3998]|uniref:DUF1275 domain-containing protein n=1 Tax=Paenibacillus sp. SYP-B3998 TaxID=2678564 RepID=A0A6G3ZZM6_9BACL|nr:YoaK family protein [Paenibacillus sp. SYP-B3998]NEW07663.1 DUF1275 domain-containing protein [Paenibacillus sp. SYP-B3998]